MTHLAAPTPVTVQLFAGSLACDACGQGVPDHPDAPTIRAQIEGRVGQEHLAMLRAHSPRPIEFRTCLPCRERRAVADRAVSRLPGLAGRFGPDNARYRLGLALDALAALGRRLPDAEALTEPDAAALVRHLTIVGGGVRYMSRFVPVAWSEAEPGTSAAYPWAHLTDEQSARLRDGYGALMAERVARNAPPVRLAPPEGRACMLCGLGHVTRPAAEVVAHGGTEAAQRRLWRIASASPDALGGDRSPDRLRGSLCPTCDAVVSDIGAIGIRAMERAYEQLLRQTGRTAEANVMRYDETSVRLTAWAALDHRERRAGRKPIPPNREPWQHIRARTTA